MFFVDHETWKIISSTNEGEICIIYKEEMFLYADPGISLQLKKHKLKTVCQILYPK